MTELRMAHYYISPMKSFACEKKTFRPKTVIHDSNEKKTRIKKYDSAATIQKYPKWKISSTQ